MPWQATLQPAATPIMREIRWFEQYTLWFIVPITLFVLVLLIVVCWKFRASANPVPSKTSHNTVIEVIWTVGPVLILLLPRHSLVQPADRPAHAAGKPGS